MVDSQRRMGVVATVRAAMKYRAGSSIGSAPDISLYRATVMSMARNTAAGLVKSPMPTRIAPMDSDSAEATANMLAIGTNGDELLAVHHRRQ